MKFIVTKIIKLTFFILFILYLSYLSYLTFFDQLYGREFLHRSINLIPFKTIIQFLTTPHNTKSVIVNILGNIAAFMPMGFLLPIIFRRLTEFKKLLLVVFAATVLIETIQFIAGVGASDIDDIMLNLAGGILGYIIYKIVTKIYKTLLGIIILK